jgi:hypothetical protein
MYDVIIRKSLRHADGSIVLYEDQWKVNHERHAVNLAGKIARDRGVEWVEVEEITGRFKARANLGPNGIVHESLESARRKSTRKRSARKGTRKRRAIFWVVLTALVLFGLFILMTSR